MPVFRLELRMERWFAKAYTWTYIWPWPYIWPYPSAMTRNLWFSLYVRLKSLDCTLYRTKFKYRCQFHCHCHCHFLDNNFLDLNPAFIKHQF